MQQSSISVGGVKGGWSQALRTKLKDYERIPVSLRLYCQVCDLGLLAPNKQIVQQEDAMKGGSRPPTGNFNNFVGFLRSPNVRFDFHNETDPKRRAEMEAAGRRIVDTIAYGWDYLFRLVRGVVRGDGEGRGRELVGVYTEQNVESARQRLRDMLRELRDNKYHWENYAKEVRAVQEREQREIEEEETFIRLLQNILSSQTEKVLVARRNQNQSQQAVKPERAEEVVKDAGEGIIIVQEGGKKSISELINVKEYFGRKIGRMLAEQTVKPNLADPIARCEQQRRFNAAALRYYSERS